MTHVLVRRRKDVLVLLVLVGALLLATAYEVAILRKYTELPETNDAGVLTTRGQTQRRTDLMWGGVLGVGGAAMVFAGVGSLVRRSTQFAITDDGLEMNIAPGDLVFIPWEDILTVGYRGVPGAGSRVRPSVAVQLRDDVRPPGRVSNADVVSQTIFLNADMWDVPAEQVAVAASLALASATNMQDTFADLEG
ncbi:MAG: hypothetical protein IIC71_07385 [Acidobacteria bacterium]|nr:hypothetical protein [Acidobacteriota bacterium]